MSKNTSNPIVSHKPYSIDVDLEALKFIYISCSRAVADMDFEHLNDHKSIEKLQTCIYLFEQLERLDPDWLVEHGYSFKKGFHLSWIHWIQALNH